MYLIEVIPIARAINKETLSYFSAEPIEAGTLVEIPLKTKTAYGLVLSARNAKDIKGEIRSAPFAIRKIETIRSTHFLTEAFMRALSRSADYFVTTRGAALFSLVPKVILEDDTTPEEAALPGAEPRKLDFEKYIFQAGDEERFANYKSFIREQFAKGKSVFFCLPTAQDIEKALEFLPRGIEEYTYIFHSALTKKTILERWSKALATKHPILVVGTGQFLSLPRPDFGAIVIERENSALYKTKSRPYIDIRTFADLFAKEIGGKLVFGDILLRTELIARYRSGEYQEFAKPKFRALSVPNQKTIDMRQYRGIGRNLLTIVSDDLTELIQETKDRDLNLFLFASRRGMAATTICADCETVVRCVRCGASVVLHEGETPYFRCHRCGERRSAEERCVNCTSWRLVPLGIGIERVEKELKEYFADVPSFRLDKDTASTNKKARDIAKKFYATPGSILLGTEMALLYLTDYVESSAIVTLDSLFSVPDFRVNEKIVNMLLRIKGMTRENFYIQTRVPDHKVFEYAMRGNLPDFYREELREREQFHYPPYATLIKISVQGERETIGSYMRLLVESLKPYEMDVFETASKMAGKIILSGVIKVPAGKWIDESLREKLMSLPPYVSVNVEPLSIL